MQMIECEGYKAFFGTMLITPKNKNIEPFIIADKDWLYKPQYDCWYGDGRSFMSAICTVIEIKAKE